MNKYCYFPILKTKPSEMKAYINLDSETRKQILPIIEMTGARSYTYPKTCKNQELIGTKRAGDINKKRKTILDMVGEHKFILDITDDESLHYDGIAQLQNSENGYAEWIKFLLADEKFKKQVIPTIQFNTDDIANTILQIENLSKEFYYLALKIPGFIFNNNINNSNLYSLTNIVENDVIQSVIDFTTDKIRINERLIVIVDFGYIKNLEDYKTCISSCVSTITNLKNIKALLFASSSFPSFVKPIEENEMEVQELKLFDFCRQNLNNDNKILHCDYASIHPVQYQTSGGGWIPRIDYINQEIKELKYCYKRAQSSEKYKNDSDEYVALAKKVLNSNNYSRILNKDVWGDIQIHSKANGIEEGKSPAHWIAVRANLYMTRILDIMSTEEFGYSYLTL